MSAIGGIFARLGDAPRGCNLRGLVQHLRQMGPHGERWHHSNMLSMVHCRLDLDPQYTQKSHLYSEPEGNYLFLDGRIDNDDEFAQDFGVRDSGDWSKLLLRIYQESGIQGFRRLVGDFAFALWDARNESVVLCCDPIGCRPLFYSITPRYVAWASRCSSVRDVLNLGADVDEEHVADFLCNRPSQSGAFRHIQQLRGGHCLVVSKDSHVLKQYWNFEANKEICYRTDHEYEQHFRHLFFQAVGCRIRHAGTVFSELSGGLDSTSIVCAADSLAANDDKDGSKLRTASFVYGNSSSDESPYIHLVEAHRGCIGLHLDDDSYPILAPISCSLHADFPSRALLYLSQYNRIAAEMKEGSSRILLSGMGGDQLFWSEPTLELRLADLASSGEVGKLMREARQIARQTGWPQIRLLWDSLKPFYKGGLIPHASLEMAKWLRTDFVKRLNLQERSSRMADDIGFRLPSSATQYAIMRRTPRLSVLESVTPYYIEMRFPYLDRRLMEFALAIPLEQKLRGDQTRSIVRRAMRGILPEKIRTRISKAGPEEALLRAAYRERAQLMGLCSDLMVAAYGFADRALFAQAIKNACHGVVTNWQQFTGTLALEFWLRSLNATHEMRHAELNTELSPATAVIN